MKILTHLHDTCARITANSLKENNKQLNQAYDLLFPFETLVDQIEDAFDFSLDEKSPTQLNRSLLHGTTLLMRQARTIRATNTGGNC